MNPKDFPYVYRTDGLPDAEPETNPNYVDYEAESAKRAELWAKYFDDYRDPVPIRGVLVCEECGGLVFDSWQHIDWHEGEEDSE